MKGSIIAFYNSIVFIIVWCIVILLSLFQIGNFVLVGGELEVRNICVLLFASHFLVFGSINQACNYSGTDIVLYERFINNETHRVALTIISLGLFNTLVLFFASKAYKKMYSMANVFAFLPIVNIYVYWTLGRKYLSFDAALSLFIKGKLAYFLYLKESNQ